MNNESLQERVHRMLQVAPSDIDKRETSFAYQTLAMTVPELIELELKAYEIDRQTYPDTCDWDYLVEHCRGRIEPIMATRGIVVAEFNRDIQGNEVFVCNDVRYTVVEKITEETPELEENIEEYPHPPKEENKEYCRYRLVCEEYGHVETIGDIVPTGYVEGLNLAKIIYIEKDGRETETIESLRRRYFESTNYQAFGGNRADYINIINEVENIGAIKVERRKEGQEFIHLTAIGLNGEPLSEEMVKQLQNKICPDKSSDGFGIAPIGHRVEVSTAEIDEITNKTKLTLESDADVSEMIKTSIKNYLVTVAEEWGKESGDLIVRIAHIENAILNIDGVIDVEETSINGIAKNYKVKDNCIPKLKGVEFIQ